MSDLPPTVSPPTQGLDAPPPAKEPAIRIPPVTGWLIALNVLIHLVRKLLPPGKDDVVVAMLGFNASGIHTQFGPLDAVSLVTYQFLHGGWDHLGINMVSLLAFGPGVERPIGKARFLILYILSGIAGALLEAVFAAPNGDDLLIGASASISGAFGALMVIWGLYRMGRNPLGFIRMTALWVALLALTGILGVGAPADTPVAWVAHIGGFIAGIGLGYLFRPRPRTF